MKTQGLQPDVISYNAAISACEKGLQWEKALHFLSEMRTQGLQPDVISYNAAISACEKGLQWEKALQLLSEMKTQGHQPDVIERRFDYCRRNYWDYEIRRV
jgi:pentatricopeptide repeat domain-containing protein 1